MSWTWGWFMYGVPVSVVASGLPSASTSRSGKPGALAIELATSIRNPSMPRSNQNRRIESNSSATSGFSQFQSGCSGANRWRYHWPGVPSASVVRSQARPPNIAGQLFGGIVAVGARRRHGR